MKADWKPADQEPPEGEYVLLSFECYPLPAIGRCEDGVYYLGDELMLLKNREIYVNGWMKLPKCKGFEENQKNGK